MSKVSTGSGVVDEVLSKSIITREDCLNLMDRLTRPSEFPTQLDASSENLSRSKMTSGLKEILDKASDSLTIDDLARIRMSAISKFQEILTCNSDTKTTNPHGAAGWSEIAIHAESLRIEKSAGINLSKMSL